MVILFYKSYDMFYTIFSILILPITVKILDLGEDSISSPAETADIRASFGQEVSVWHKLDHPNVTKVKKTSLTSFKYLCSKFN